MEQLYRFVKASERKPDKEKLYWCRVGEDNYPLNYFNGGFYFLFGEWKPDEYIEWLEPIEESEQDGLRLIKVEFKDHTKIVLTNKHGDTYTSSSEELGDFFH